MTARAPRRPFVAALAGFAVALSGLAVITSAAPAQANVDPDPIAAFPYAQDWSNGALITTADDWSGVVGVQGYRGDALSNSTSTNPQTVTADGSATPTNVIANGLSSSGTGGVLEAAAEQTIALQGSGTADAPHVVFHLDLAGKAGAQFSFDARDIDAQATEAIQQIAVQYRVGSTGAYTDLPAGYIADASSGPSLATLVTHRDVELPVATDNQSEVYVRVITNDAIGADEWIGIDNIAITADDAATGGLVISEVYGGGTSSGAANSYANDFIELENRSSAEINLEGWSVQYHSATGTGQFAVHELHGRIPAGKKYLIQEGTFPNGNPMPTPEETGALSLSSSSGVVALVSNTTPYPTFGTTTGVDLAGVTDNGLVDLVGYGTTANTYETARTGTVLSTTLSASRKPTEDTDDNSADFTTGVPTPEQCNCPLPLAASNQAGVTSYMDEPIAPFTLQATGGTAPYHWEATGLPDALTIADDGTVSGTPTTIGTYPVTATVTDTATVPDSDTVEFTITVETAPQLLTIAEIQGTGDASTVDGDIVITRGVVTARYPSGPGSMAGFVIQTGGEEGVDYDTAGASDAVFVFSGNKTAPAIGESVEVKGEADERFGSTQINASSAAGTITALPTPQPAVVPNDVIPGTDCAQPGNDCPTAAELNTAREEYEFEAFQPTGPYTVTDSYDGSPGSSFGMQGEIGIAAERDLPLMIPTETIDQSDSAAIAAYRAYNAAHLLILDDAKSINYDSAANEDTPFPWYTADHPVRTGAPVTFPQPVILKYDFGSWRILPREEVAGGEDGQDLVAIENTRLDNLAPENVLGATGDLKIATFNMLNYFNTFGEVYADSDGVTGGSPGTTYNFANPRRCSYYTDRGPVPPATGNAVRITNNTCEQDVVDPLTGLNVKVPGPRGAANETSFLRQEVKLVNAINTIDADVMSLEEVENSIKLYDAALSNQDPADSNRDDALQRLVSKLNEAAGDPNRWAFVASPRPEALPTVQEQDAIRNAFIYNPATVETVGRSQVLVNSPAMRNAREPLAQAFKPSGSGRDDAFIVIVNHFKSKGGAPAGAPPETGDNVDTGDGAGSYNGDRKRQAAALVAFADQVSSDKNIEPVFLTGDFNAYSAEDPVQVIEGGGYTNLKPSNGQTSYNFGGLSGSLDHVFANEAAEAMVTGEDIWEINANEAVYYEYSRFNYNAAQLYDESVFRSSDHNPEIIGIDVGDFTPDPLVDTVQILATNDFHGRLVDDPGSAAAGAASMAGAVKELRIQNDSTIFAAAGDLVGGTTFESFIQNDEPTIDALNEAGLEVSSVGNHEFDQGFDDLVTRIMVHAEWEYLGANVEFKDTEGDHQAGDPALPETWCETLPNGRVVGFVGAVTEDLPALVAGEGIADIVVTDIVDAVNEHANELKTADGCPEGDGAADLVIELVHEGAATTAYSSVTDNSTFAQIVEGANANVDAIVSGHTHLAYNHKVPVQAWIDQNRDVTERPVVSAGQYGANLNRLQFEFEPGANGDLINIRQTVLQLKDYDPDPATQEIVDDAVDFAEAAGNDVLGEIENPFLRARRTGEDGQVNENRGGESTIGNLIAEMQRWKTEADIGFMNPGGVRADLLGLDGTPRDVTYRQAANTQPFANTLVTMDLTGAQIKLLLEQQWQRDADNNIPSRPFLRLGTSEGFTSTFDASKAEGSRITGMWLDGDPIVMSDTYKVSATSFLAGGGDNFKEFVNGTNKQDTGKTDLQAVVDYLAAEAPDGGGTPLPVEYAQHQVGVKISSAAAAPYVAGNTLTLDVSSLAMTGEGDLQDTQVQLLDEDDNVLGTAPVNNTRTVDPVDSVGTGTLSNIVVPAGVGDGTTVFTLVGNNTGTEITVPVQTSDGLVDSTVDGTDQTVVHGDAGSVPVTVTPSTAGGTVTLKNGVTTIGSTSITGGSGSIALPAGSLPVGNHVLTLEYAGDGVNGPATGTVNVNVLQATPSLNIGTPNPASVVVNGGTSTIAVTVNGGSSPGGTVTASIGGNVVDTETLVAGSATLTVGPFATVGNKTVTIAYSGDTNNAPVSGTTTVGVTQAGSTVSATGGPVSYGTGWNAAVTVTPTAATGQVEVLEGSTSLGTANVSSGSASVAISGTALSPGTHTLTVTYAGDDNHEASTNTFQVTVNKAATSVAAIGDTVQVGTPWSASVFVTPAAATGGVEVFDGATSLGTATLSNGTASVAIAANALPVGTHTLTVNYAGDANHEASTSTFTVIVTEAPPTETTVSATCPTVTFGTGWSSQVTVTPSTAAGTVTILDGPTTLGSATLSGGTASVAISGTALPVGTHTLTVSYSGDETHESSTSTCSVTVEAPPDNETVTSVSGLEAMHYGTATTATVTVTSDGPVTGTVEIREGGTLIGSAQLGGGGTASIVIPGTALSVGAHTLTVRYLGDDNNEPSETNQQVQVAKAISSTELTVEPGKIVVGQDQTTLTAEVSATGVTPTGQVVFEANGVEIGTAPISGGEATLTIGPANYVTTYEITATYQGNANVATSSETADLKVIKADVSIKANVKPNRVVVDKTKSRIQITVVADGQVVTGEVEVTWRGESETVKLENGKAVVILGKWGTTGEKTVTVHYLGSAKAKQETKQVTFNVRRK